MTNYQEIVEYVNIANINEAKGIVPINSIKELLSTPAHYHMIMAAKINSSGVSLMELGRSGKYPKELDDQKWNLHFTFYKDKFYAQNVYSTIKDPIWEVTPTFCMIFKDFFTDEGLKIIKKYL